MQIEFLELSARAEHCLLRADIDTVEKFCECTSDDLMRLRGFGKGSMSEVKEALSREGKALRRF